MTILTYLCKQYFSSTISYCLCQCASLLDKIVYIVLLSFPRDRCYTYSSAAETWDLPSMILPRIFYLTCLSFIFVMLSVLVYMLATGMVIILQHSCRLYYSWACVNFVVFQQLICNLLLSVTVCFFILMMHLWSICTFYHNVSMAMKLLIVNADTAKWSDVYPNQI